MDTREVECFVKTYEMGSITKAAKDLFISPQGLSKMLAKLEADLGVTLLVRSNKGVSSTEAGRVFYEHAKELIADLEDLESSLDTARRTKPPLTAVLGLGVRSFLGYEASEAFRLCHPEILFDESEHPDATAYQLLEDERADVGVIPGPPDPRKFMSQIIASIPHVAIVREDDPIAQAGIARYKDFEGKRLVMVSRMFKPYEKVLGKLARHDIRVERVDEAGEILKVSQIVRKMGGIGISVLSEALDYTYPGTIAVPIEDPELSWDIYLVRLEGKPATSSVTDFCNYIRQWCAEGRPEFSNCNILLSDTSRN